MNLEREPLGVKRKTPHAQPQLHSLKRDLESAPAPLTPTALAQLCRRHGIIAHLAILARPYLDEILEGRKSIESRFTNSKQPPYGQVKPTDVLLLKETSGPIRGLAAVSMSESFGPLRPGQAEAIMHRFWRQLRIRNEFVAAKRSSRYATLIHLGSVIKLAPVPVAKTDRRPWILLSQEANRNNLADQLTLLEDVPRCESGLHVYHGSKRLNSRGWPVCKYCGADNINWERLHRRDIDDVAFTVSQLKTEKCRFVWWHKKLDPKAEAHALRKGLAGLREATRARLRTSVGTVREMPDGSLKPYRDGYQTPYTGNVIYYAQHALACCCRKCVAYWHGIPSGRDWADEELEYFVELVMLYIQHALKAQLNQYRPTDGD